MSTSPKASPCPKFLFQLGKRDPLWDASNAAARAILERLEPRMLLSAAPLRPDHVVVVIESDRFANAIGDTANLPYFNQLAGGGLLLSSYQGINPSTQGGEMNYLGLYSGSSQGITDNGRGYSFSTANLAQELNAATGLSFAGYSETLPADGAQDQQTGDATRTDEYMRSHNPMAMFTDAGPGKVNADVNKTFNSFVAIGASQGSYANLPTVSFVVPNNLDNTNGSNEAPPFATDPNAYAGLRQAADNWLRNNIDSYAQWAKTHNSLLVIVGDSGDRQHTFAAGTEALVVGDPGLVVAGEDTVAFNHFNTLRTIEDMYGLSPLGSTAGVSGLDTNAFGQLASPTLKAGTQATGTALVSSANPSVYGQGLTLTATVTGATPTGIVLFKDGTTTLATGTLNGSGVATFTTTTLSVGSHSLKAVYAGDSANQGSTSSIITDVVNPASTAVALSSSANPASVGQTVTFTATVTAVAPGAGIPTGTVTFMDGVTTLGTGTLSASGVATFTTAGLSVATHSITAVYAASTNFATSTSAALSQSVTAAAKVATSTTLGVSSASAVYGQSVTFTATVTPSGAGTPNGTVTFLDGATVLGTGTLNGVGVAALTTSSLSVTSHSITATYGGAAGFTGSTSSAITELVGQASSSTALISSLNPAQPAQSVTFTATVSAAAPGAGVPSGFVAFHDGSGTLAVNPLTNGVATYATFSLTTGTHVITAEYFSDTNFKSSLSAAVNQVVSTTATSTATALASSTNPAVTGQPVTLSATVTSGLGTPTGTVAFKDGSTVIGSGVLNGSGVATFSTSSLSVATHSLAAVYSGATNFTASTSSTLSQVINKAATTTTVASSARPAIAGQPVTYTATVTLSGSGNGVPTGSVTFKDAGATIGTGTLSASGLATFTTTYTTAATHSITAVYAGDSSFTTSTSAVYSQIVNPAALVKPDHVVIVMMEDRFANSIGDTTYMPYVNQLATGGLVFSKYQPLNTSAQQGEMNFIGLYSGATQGVTDDGLTYSFPNTANLASVFNSTTGLSFAGYSESLPSAGSQAYIAAGTGVFDGFNYNVPDQYTRAHNPMAMFDNYGTTGTAASVNNTFDAFKAIGTSTGTYANLPTVAFVSPNQINDTHGSNDADPYATDSSEYNPLRQTADTWLQQNIDGYVQWAKTHNSILILTGDEGDRAHTFANGFPTVIVGDPRIVVPGTDTATFNHFNTLRTIEDMYGVTRLGSTGSVSSLDHNDLGQLAVPAIPAAPTNVAATNGTFADRVRVTWTAPTGATGYEVWRNTTNSSGSAVKITTTDVTGTLFDDFTAATGTTYFYWIKSKNGGGTSGFSLSASGHR